MNEQDIKKAFEQMNPSEKQKQVMWGRILNHKYKKSNVVYGIIRKMAMVAAVLAMVLLSGMVINAATGGKILSTIENLFDSEKGEKVKEADEGMILPRFEYTGDDMAMKAIVEYFREYDKQYHPPRKGSTWIPAYVIYEKIELEDESIIWGFFWAYTYKLNDDVFEVDGGHGIPACIHLKKTDNGYVVVEAELAGEGAEYTSSIKKFTEGYPEVYDMIMSGDGADGEKEIECRRKFLQMYINDNNLDIKYYKDYGWEPVEIFAE